ncbi:hypothetical protein [Aquimarina sp. SS2-1]|uniref:hypothetical protein n=1 Tax=Aquimarina besae TaxID=3342247 RepID=UPI00366AE2AC
MSSTKRKKVEQWIIDYNEILSIQPLERTLGFSRGTIYKFITNNRKLTATEIKIIDRYIQNMISKYLEID